MKIYTITYICNCIWKFYIIVYKIVCLSVLQTLLGQIPLLSWPAIHSQAAASYKEGSSGLSPWEAGLSSLCPRWGPGQTFSFTEVTEQTFLMDATFLFLLQALLCCICTCLMCMETQPTFRWPMSTWRRAWGAWPGDPSRSCVVMLGPWQWLLLSTTSCRTRSRQKTASSGKSLAYVSVLTFLLLTELLWAWMRHSLTNVNTFYCSLVWEIVQ